MSLKYGYVASPSFTIYRSNTLQARSKLHVEEILQDAVIANQSISVVNLRYFNPVGAHPSGLIGEGRVLLFYTNV